MKKIIHITHTDIKNDWRIRKELISLNKQQDFSVIGIGIDYFPELDFPDDGIDTYNVYKPEFKLKGLKFLVVFSLASRYYLDYLNHLELIFCIVMTPLHYLLGPFSKSLIHQHQ